MKSQKTNRLLCLSSGLDVWQPVLLAPLNKSCKFGIFAYHIHIAGFNLLLAQTVEVGGTHSPGPELTWSQSHKWTGSSGWFCLSLIHLQWATSLVA